MVFTKFVIKPTKSDPNQTLTSFQAPQIAMASQPFQPRPSAPRPAPQPTMSQQFIGPGTGSGQTTSTRSSSTFNNSAALAGLQQKQAALNTQWGAQQAPAQDTAISDSSASSGISSPAGLSAPTGTTGPGAGGYTPPGLSPIDEPIDTGIPDPSSVSAQPFTQPGVAGAVGADGTQTGTQGQALASKYEQGFNAANAALGSTGGQLPAGTSGASMVQQYSPTRSNTLASTFVQQDPFISGLVDAWQQYISPTNQRKSLSETYQQMIADSGIQAIDTELLNSKRIIEGTTDDIRKEIAGAGGMATESQVIALSNSRSKQLIRNYNFLLETRNSKEKYLQTAIGLEQSDRESADQRFESAFSMGIQIANYGQLMRKNAIESFDRIVKTVGWNGLLQSMTPNEVSMFESAYGLPSGGAFVAAQKEMEAKMQAEQTRQLELEESRVGIEKSREQIKTEKAQQAKIYSDIAKEGLADQKTIQKRKNSLVQASTVIGKVDEALNQVGDFNVGFWGRTLGIIPGTSSYNLKKTIDTIKSNVGFQALQAMREASPTGGALGQVAVQELDMLQSTIASLDIGQSKSQLTQNLSEVKQRFENVKATIIAEEEGLEITYDDVGNIILLEN